MSESILIVDDERGIRETLSAVLRDEGFVADTAASGEECLKAIARRVYGCVLLDVWLPGIDGLETLRQMRDSNCDADCRRSSRIRLVPVDAGHDHRSGHIRSLAGSGCCHGAHSRPHRSCRSTFRLLAEKT